MCVRIMYDNVVDDDDDDEEEDDSCVKNWEGL